jgi:drug/metabolite transporter (DMT)-like permease
MTIFVYILLCLIWGSTWKAIQLGLADAPPLWSAAIRFWLAIAVLFVILKVRRLRLPTAPRELWLHGLSGILMYGISYACVYSAERFIPSSLTAVLFACFPAFVALMSHFFLPGDKLRGVGWAGLVLGLAGVIVVSWESLEASGELFLGSLLAVGAPLASALGVVFYKRHLAKTDIVVSATTQILFGGVFLTLGALLSEPISRFVWSPVSIGSILYLALFGTVLGFLGYYWLMTHISVVSASMIAFVTPLVASVIGVAIFHESFSTLTAVGGMMILLAVAIVAWSRRQPSLTAPLID